MSVDGYMRVMLIWVVSKLLSGLLLMRSGWGTRQDVVYVRVVLGLDRLDAVPPHRADLLDLARDLVR